jgi:hypothetical protein
VCVVLYFACVVLCIFVLFYAFLCCSIYCLFCVVLCTVCVYMCTVLLPPGGYPIAVKKYTISYYQWLLTSYSHFLYLCSLGKWRKICSWIFNLLFLYSNYPRFKTRYPTLLLRAIMLFSSEKIRDKNVCNGINTALPSPTYSVHHSLTLILLTWRIWWAPNNVSRWQIRFNSAFKGLIFNAVWTEI